MEKLTPNERAAYVLREAFDYSHAQIADILSSTAPAVRQLVSRARKHIASKRRAPVTAAEQRELLTTFLAAARSGDMATLRRRAVSDHERADFRGVAQGRRCARPAHGQRHHGRRT